MVLSKWNTNNKKKRRKKEYEKEIRYHDMTGDRKRCGNNAFAYFSSLYYFMLF